MHRTDIQRAQGIFARFLRGRGHSYTPQRQTILEQVLKNGTHFDVEDLIEDFRAKTLRVSRATTYRTINHLEDAGLIRKISLNESHAHYEVTIEREHHEHLVCQECGFIMEVADGPLERRIETIARDNEFAITRHEVQVFGLCCRCRKKHKSDSRLEVNR